MSPSVRRWLGWLLAAALLLAAPGCDRVPLARANAPQSTPPAADGGVPPPDAAGPSPDAAGPSPDAGRVGDAGVAAPASCPLGVAPGRAGARPPPAYVRACDAGLAPAASYTLVPDGVQTAYHRCGALGEVAESALISRDGRRLALVAAESVRLFDTATWREIARVAHAAEPIDAAALSPDGTRLATVATYISELTLWDTSDGHSVAIFTGATPRDLTTQLPRGSGIAFSSDGRRIATAMGTVVDTVTGTSIDLGSNQIRAGHNSRLWFAAGETAVLAQTYYHSGDSWGGMLIERYDAVTGLLQDSVGDDTELSGDLTQAVGVKDYFSSLYAVHGIGLPTPVTELNVPLSTFPGVDWERSGPAALDEHGELLALSNGTELQIVETLHPDHEVARIPLPAGTAVVGVSPANELVTSGPCGTIAWNWRTAETRWAQPFTVRTITWSADGSVAVATGPGALFRVWRTDTGGELCAPPGGQAVTDRVFSADGRKVLVRYDDGSVELRNPDLTGPRPIALPAVGAGTPLALANGGEAVAVWVDEGLPSPAEAPPRRLVVRRLDGTPAGNGPLDTSYRPYRTALSPDLTRALYQSDLGPRLVDLGRGTTIASWDWGSSVIGFNPDGTRFALGTRDGIATYSSADGSAGPVMRPAGQPAIGKMLSADWSVAVSDNAYASGSGPDGGTAIRWQPPDGLAQTIPADDLGPATLSTDGALIVRTDQVWHEFGADYYDTIVRDAATGALLQRFSDHPVTPSADGRRLFGNGGAVFCR